MSETLNGDAVPIYERLDMLDTRTIELRQDLDAVQALTRRTFLAAANAANTALEVKVQLEELRKSTADAMTDQTAQIIRLISTDRTHDEKLARFDAAVAESVKRQLTELHRSASKVRSSVTRTVTIPVATIASIATIIQWILQHFGHR